LELPGGDPNREKDFQLICEMNLTAIIETATIDISPTKGNQMCDNCGNNENELGREINEQISEMSAEEMLGSLILAGSTVLAFHADNNLITPQMVQYGKLLEMFAGKFGDDEVLMRMKFTNIQVGEVWAKVKAEFDEWVANGGNLGEGA
jgi:hypothetical protein